MFASLSVHNSAIRWAAVGALLLATGCQDAARPALRTPADSLAASLVEASGGFEAWDALPALRWDWVVQNDSAELRRVAHLWDRAGDRARVEWSGRQDTTLVAVIAPGSFDPDAPAGLVARTIGDGPTETLSGTDALDELRAAHTRWVNDAYWMLAPLKTFDPGVRRTTAPDSGEAVLELSFLEVGLTPSDRYWMRLGPDGGITGWTYVLEGDPTPTRWTWAEPVDVTGPAGPVRLWTSKRKDGTPLEIRTEPLPVPAFDEATFADLVPRLLTPTAGEPSRRRRGNADAPRRAADAP